MTRSEKTMPISLSLDEEVCALKCRRVREALKQTDGHITSAARLLGMSNHQRLEAMLNTPDYKHLRVNPPRPRRKPMMRKL